MSHVPECIYLVDDEPKVRAAICKTLERTGMTVVGFGCAEDCLTRLETEQCDLLITDVRMPGKDGIELLTAVKQLQPWLPVVVITGFGDVPMAVKALKEGAADFIEKPLDRDSFLDVVRRLLARNPVRNSLVRRSLTRTEMAILYHILDGRNNREMADMLHRSSRTIEVHRRHLMQKMGATNIVELLRQAAELRLFDMGTPAAGAARETREA